MQQIIIKKDQSRLIPVLLGSASRHHRPSVIPAKAGIGINSNKDRIPDWIGDDKRLDIILAGENAQVEVVGLVIGKGTDEKVIETNITHAAPNTKSNVNVRAVVRGKSQFSFRGNVRIEKGAKGADAYLRSDALLFDDAKMGDDTPALEILEKDVKAGHAATVGKVDEKMLFYLMSRGLTKTQAEKMLVEGFIEPIKEKLNAERLKPKAKI